MNTLVFVLDLEGLLGETLAITDVTLHVHRREEVHLDRDKAIALTGLTASTRPVK